MATMIQQQPSQKMGSSTLEPLLQKRFPLVHILTSKPENDDEKVRLVNKSRCKFKHCL